MQPNEIADQTKSFKIDPATTVGAVSLAVSDITKMSGFYQAVIGLSILNQSQTSAILGVGRTPLVRLVSRAGGKRYSRTTGLFHLALLLPGRPDLGNWLRHLTERKYPLDGAGDHLVSEALYLTDPEGNGIEVYCDRARETWQFDENGIKMDTLAVDRESLLAEVSDTPFLGMPSGAALGHIHLKVGDLQETMAFYQDILGFDLMTTLPGAAFFSAGGYHHRIGANIWQSRGAAPPPLDALGLVSFEILLPDKGAAQNILNRVEESNLPIDKSGENLSVQDPAGNRIEFKITG